MFSQGFRFRKNDKRLPGTPDIVLPRYRTVIFVNGCFWHGHSGCKYFVWPKSNADFWKSKIEKNIIRDRIKEEELHALGWRVIVVWECELKSGRADESLEQLKRNILEGEQWEKTPNMTL